MKDSMKDQLKGKADELVFCQINSFN
jgi:hypothetical protein